MKHTLISTISITGAFALAAFPASAGFTFRSETPVITPAGQEFQLLGQVVNDTESEIEGFSVTLVADGKEFTKDYSTRVLVPGASADVTWRTGFVPEPGCGGFDYTVRLASPSAEGDEYEGAVYVRTRRWVVEERTGTWCAACPWGIYVFERLQEKLGDEFIGIALHTYGNDPMGIPDWQLSDFTTNETAPYTLVNRMRGCHPRDLEGELEKMASRDLRASFEEASCTLDPENRELSVDTKVMFGADYSGDDSDLRIGYFIIENDVNVDSHQYAQRNGYAGTDNLPGWGDLPALVEGKDMWHQHVGRGFSQDVRGVPGSVPSEVEAGEIYEFSHTLTLPDNVLEIKNCKLVLMILDGANGNVLNGLELPLEGSYNGVEAPDCGETAPAYYDLAGIRVAPSAMRSGIYIEVRGSKSRKVRVR